MCLLATALMFLSLGCATHGPLVDETVLSFRLEWLGTADLDLHVRTPLDKEIWFVDRRSPSGGVLDIDCNVDPGEACTEPVETVAWPPGQAPEGTYQYWVRLMHPRGTTLPVSFTVVVRRGGRVIEERQGELAEPGNISVKWEVSYAPAR